MAESNSALTPLGFGPGLLPMYSYLVALGRISTWASLLQKSVPRLVFLEVFALAVLLRTN